MGNPARVADGATVFSTSTRNFPNPLGKDAMVYLGYAELAAVTALKVKLPTSAKFLDQLALLDPMAADVYRYLNVNVNQLKDTARSPAWSPSCYPSVFRSSMNKLL